MRVVGALLLLVGAAVLVVFGGGIADAMESVSPTRNQSGERPLRWYLVRVGQVVFALVLVGAAASLLFG